LGMRSCTGNKRYSSNGLKVEFFHGLLSECFLLID